MSSHRFFLSSTLAASVEIGDEVHAPLSADDLHRAARTARLEEGERIVLVDPGRTIWECDVVSITPQELVVTLMGTRSIAHEPDVTLFAGVTKGHKMDLTVAKSVEVGVSAIVPVMCERSIVRWSPEKAADRAMRWQRVSTAAAAQAQRAFIPEVEPPTLLAHVVERVSAFDTFLVAWEESGRRALSDAVESQAFDARVGILVGPEGGLTAEEVGMLEDAGATSVSLGHNIMRSETAGIVLAALTVYEMGGLGGRSRG